MRDLRALEKGTDRKLETRQLMLAFDEWHRLSQPFLDPAKTRDDYLAAFLAERGKVWVPTDEGDTLNKAFEAVAKLSDSELPVIPGMPDALSYRDAAKVFPGLTPQKAYSITLALAALGVIEIISKGKAGPNGKAAEFRYLLSDG